MVKVTKEKSAENRSALVRAAGTLFRERGIDGVGVAEISKAAGLTHGALYAQFSSKDELAVEAFADGLERSYLAMMSTARDGGASLSAYLDFLISKKQRDNLARGCPIAASGSEIARQNKTVSSAFARGFERLVAAVEAVIEPAAGSASPRERALAIITAEIGAIVVARGVSKARPDLSEELLAATRRMLGQVGGEDGAPQSKGARAAASAQPRRKTRNNSRPRRKP